MDLLVEDEIPSFFIPRCPTKDCVVVLTHPVIPPVPAEKAEKTPEPEVPEGTKREEQLVPGCLLWASMTKKDVSWPCILAQSLSPEKDKYHVIFFGNSGGNAWVKKWNVTEFSGKDEELAFSHCSKEKLKRLNRPQWEVAVQEAEMFLRYPIEERMGHFIELVQKQKALMLESAKRKRERRESQESKRKRLKLDIVREKSTEQSESGISTSGSVSPCPTLDLMSLGSATPIRVTPEPTKRPRKTVDLDGLFFNWQNLIQEELTALLKSQKAVCRFCGQSEDPMIRCTGRCGEAFHSHCTGVNVNLSGDPDSSLRAEKSLQVGSLCSECSDSQKICFICSKSIDADPLTCDEKFCSRSFHRQCLKTWPQMKLSLTERRIDKFTCPQHICHICSSDDPAQHGVERKERLLRCILCPSTYHSKATCVPAGGEILSASRLICPRHWPLASKHVNVNWCFICVKGGTLLCCDNCPSAVHESCARTTMSDASYICDDCESGRALVYGDLVWAKQAQFRWWPAIILTETCAPISLQNTHHQRGDICTYFLGSHDWTWLPRRRMFLYQEDDAEFKKAYTKGAFSSSFPLSLQEANHMSRVVKLQKVEQIVGKRQPPVYKKILMNKVIPPVKVRDMIVEVEQVDTRCRCNVLDFEEKCGALSSCVNRIAQIECTEDSCAAGGECQNRRFTQRLYPATEIVRTARCGWGLIARQPLNEGDFITEYVGEIINSQEMEWRIRHKQEERNNVYYFLTLTPHLTIDAEHKGNNSRFINHSCDPNCMTQKWTVKGVMRIGIFAIKDIPEGEELTFNYQWEEKRDAVGAVCECGTEKCSGVIGKQALKVPKVKPKAKEKKKKKKKRIKIKVKGVQG